MAVRTYTEKACARCGKKFMPTGPAALFCSDPCRRPPLDCEWCGSTFQGSRIKSTREKQRFCSKRCHYRWRGREKKSRASGYVLINVGRDYPGARPDGRILEHRYIMQEHLGRPLLPHESVHHRDGNKENNQVANLELWEVHQPKGQRSVDLPHCATCTCNS